MPNINKILGDSAYSFKKLLPQNIIDSLNQSSFYKNLREKRLTSRKSLSQAAQDYWVINEAFDHKEKGYFVEIGSADGIRINNTYLLEKCYQWSGICIEANPIYFEQLKRNRSAICLNVCVDGREKEIDFICDDLHGGIIDEDTDNRKKENIKNVEVRRLRTKTLANILEEHKAPEVIDYLSIDVEGAETRILADFPFDKYIFNSMTIERPSEFLHNLLIQKGYIWVKLIPGLDSFYIHKSFQKIYGLNQCSYYRTLRSMY
jgi:FkbM family methyltransferase